MSLRHVSVVRFTTRNITSSNIILFVARWKLERTVWVFCDTEKKEKEKDSRYIQRIMRENFDASPLATLSHLPPDM